MSTFIITGASSGIGAELSRQCALQNHDLVLIARRKDRLEEIAGQAGATGSRILTFAGDVREFDFLTESITEAISQFGKIDIAIANAGVGYFAPFNTMEISQIFSMMEINYSGAVNLFRAVLPHFMETRKGHLVSVASIAGLMGYAGMAGYSASKFALIGLMEGLYGELKPLGIHTTTICPGEISTEFFDTADRSAMPRAADLIKPLNEKKVARVILKAIQKKRFRVVIPFSASLYMRIHRVFPGISLRLFNWISRLMEKD